MRFAIADAAPDFAVAKFVPATRLAAIFLVPATPDKEVVVVVLDGAVRPPAAAVFALELTVDPKAPTLRPAVSVEDAAGAVKELTEFPRRVLVADAPEAVVELEEFAVPVEVLLDAAEDEAVRAVVALPALFVLSESEFADVDGCSVAEVDVCDAELVVDAVPV